MRRTEHSSFELGEYTQGVSSPFFIAKSDKRYSKHSSTVSYCKNNYFASRNQAEMEELMNIVALTGRLTADPILSKSTTGVSVTVFNIAVNRNYKKEGGQEADFIRVVAWRNTAEFICRYFRKGTKIEINGELQSRTFKDKETGKNRTIMEVVANQASFAESKSSGDNKSSEKYNGGTNYQQKATATTNQTSQVATVNELDADGFLPLADEDGDLPF